MAEENNNELEWTTKRGADVTVRARDGHLYTDINSDGLTLKDQKSHLRLQKDGRNLYVGRHKDKSGEEFDAFIPLSDSRRKKLKEMRDDSEPEHEYSEEVQEAIEEAKESGEKVEIDSRSTTCNDSSRECGVDTVTRYATPDGEIETDRRHTY